MANDAVCIQNVRDWNGARRALIAAVDVHHLIAQNVDLNDPKDVMGNQVGGYLTGLFQGDGCMRYAQGRYSFLQKLEDIEVVFNVSNYVHRMDGKVYLNAHPRCVDPVNGRMEQQPVSWGVDIVSDGYPTQTQCSHTWMPEEPVRGSEAGRLAQISAYGVAISAPHDAIAQELPGLQKDRKKAASGLNPFISESRTIELVNRELAGWPAMRDFLTALVQKPSKTEAEVSQVKCLRSGCIKASAVVLTQTKFVIEQIQKESEITAQKG